jgi:release factor glutamine methyltransferase
MNLVQAQQLLRERLTAVYENSEAATITDWVLQKLTGLTKIDRLINKYKELAEGQQLQLADYIVQLCSHRPVQYVLQEADFHGFRFYVDENVLIPRPETEELVNWILIESGQPEGAVLDIGTGSGCIAVTIKKKKPTLDVSACDISRPALEIAAGNAARNGTSVRFFECDILEPTGCATLPVYDLIVSNPPYIPAKDKLSMSANVLNYEPHLALFTAGNDPYIFYRAIAEFGRNHLSSGGKLFFEIHHEGGNIVSALLKGAGYRHVELRNDMYGNARMIMAIR